jgi:predicted enzyme related to lactoylglutathione lyase
VPNSIAHFEIPADDVKRAKKFYEKAMGWKIADPMKMGYYFVETIDKGKPGINGGLMQRKMPGQPFMNYISVDSIDAACKKVEKAGGKIALPKQEIGNHMGWIAAFLDTEGNLMGFHEMPKKAPVKKAAGRKAVKAKKK